MPPVLERNSGFGFINDYIKFKSISLGNRLFCLWLEIALKKEKKMKVLMKRGFSIITAAAMMITMCFGGIGISAAYAAESSKEISPVVVMTGTDVIGGSSYNETNIANEKVYTMDELKSIAAADSGKSADNTYLFSAVNTYPNKSIYKAEGVRVEALLKHAGMESLTSSLMRILASDGYEVVFDPAKTETDPTKPPTTTTLTAKRYYYPNIGKLDFNDLSEQNIFNAEKDAVEVPAIIAWARTDRKGNTDITKLGDYKEWNNDEVQFIAGQLSVTDCNNPLWNGETNCLTFVAGDELSNLIKINGKKYTRAEMLARDNVIRKYAYTKQDVGEVYKYAQGVPVADFLGAFADNDLVTFNCADGFSGGTFTKKELVDGNFMLAYKTGDTEANLKPVFDTAKTDSNIKGYFTLYGDGKQPAKFINDVTVKMVPNAPTNFKAARYGYNSIKLSWDAVDGADGYVVSRWNTAKQKYEDIITTQKTTCINTSSNLKTGTKYTYRVRAYNQYGEENVLSAYSAKAYATPTLSTPSNFKAARAGYNSIKLTWTPVSGASGYYIYRYNSSKKGYYYYTKVTGGTAKSYTNKNLSTGKNYYYKIKAYRVVDGKNVYSDVTSRKYAAPTLSTPSITKLSPGSKRIYVDWTGISGAHGYKLYRATSKYGTYKYIKKTTSSYYTNKYLTKGRMYYYKVKAYRIVNGKYVYSNYSTVKYTRAK